MNYSNEHKSFAFSSKYYNNINEQEVLEHPENYLGPNYREVLNLWFYMDSLSSEQWKVYLERLSIMNMQDGEIFKEAYKISKKLAAEVIDPRFIIFPICAVELEIIAAHLYIERNIPFTFLPLIFDL